MQSTATAAASSTSSTPQNQRPETPQTPHSYLSALREIESPPLGGLNLAATLSTHTLDGPEADLIEEANISFLRTPIDPQGEWQARNAAAAQGDMQGDGHAGNGAGGNGLSGASSSSSSRLRLQQEMLRETGAEDRLRRERLHRVLQRLNRVHVSAYGDRTPSQNNLHDWAPATQSNDDSFDEQLEEILHELRQHQPAAETETLHPSRPQSEAEREYRSRTHGSRYIGDGSSSLRSAAVLQSVRRHPRFSARSRDYMQRYILERDRTANHEGDETRARYSVTNSSDPTRYDYPRSTWQPSSRSQDSSSSIQRDTRGASRRSYYADGPHGRRGSISAQSWVESAIRYLARIRSCETYEEGLSEAVEAGFVTKDFFGEAHDDFVLNIGFLPKPAKTSWLAPGMVFSGSQHATPPTPSSSTSTRTATTTRYMLGNNDSITSTTYSSNLPLPNSFDASRPWLNHVSSQSAFAVNPHPGRWPVKVTIHEVDYDTMTLSATMEAYNVPSHPPSYNNIIALANGNQPPTSQRTSSITTYLEGEILDFHNYTFLTESFHSSLTTDATYWSKLEPFILTTDTDLVHNLVSRSYHERLNQEYILMRWKERCFVSSASGESTSRRARAGGDEVMEVAEDGCGLTISGFYYVCLRRSDGGVEGLYYDPQSSPYQHLRLRPVGGGGGGGGTWSFR